MKKKYSKDEEATQQFHEVPKFLPPRKDLRKIRILEDDPDFKEVEEDKDLEQD